SSHGGSHWFESSAAQFSASEPHGEFAQADRPHFYADTLCGDALALCTGSAIWMAEVYCPKHWVGLARPWLRRSALWCCSSCRHQAWPKTSITFWSSEPSIRLGIQLLT